MYRDLLADYVSTLPDEAQRLRTLTDAELAAEIGQRLAEVRDWIHTESELAEWEACYERALAHLI